MRRILPLDDLPPVLHYDRVNRTCNCNKEKCKICRARKYSIRYYIKHRAKILTKRRNKYKVPKKVDELEIKMNEYFEKVKDQEYWDNVRIKDNGD